MTRPTPGVCHSDHADVILQPGHFSCSVTCGGLTKIYKKKKNKRKNQHHHKRGKTEHKGLINWADLHKNKCGHWLSISYQNVIGFVWPAFF